MKPLTILLLTLLVGVFVALYASVVAAHAELHRNSAASYDMAMVKKKSVGAIPPARPPPNKRLFNSTAVEAFISGTCGFVHFFFVLLTLGQIVNLRKISPLG